MLTHSQKIEEIIRLAEEGVSKGETAKRIGLSRMQLYRILKSHPEIKFRRGSISKPIDLRAEIADMPPAEAIEYLLGLLEMSEPKNPLEDAYRLVPTASRMEAKLLSVLLTKPSRVFTTSALLDAITFSRAGEPPNPKLINVMICNLRRKIHVAEAPITIRTIWGTGYAIEVTDKA